MQKFVRILFFSGILYYLASCVSFTNQPLEKTRYSIKELRKLYSSGDPSLWPKPLLAEEAKEGFQDIGHLPEMPFPLDNPYTKEKAELGKKLFFDPRLSESKQIACASCHDPELAWTDNRTVSFGHDRQAGVRNAMSIINSGYAKKLFWDGRSETLEDQAMEPIKDPKEMNEHTDFAVDKIAKVKGYETYFENAFGSKKVTTERISKALATFERTLVSGSTKFDQFISGKTEVLSDDEITGMHLYRTKAQCINCHNTGYFSNNKFENIGTALLSSRHEDLGRYQATKSPDDVGKFRVPSLREVARTGPWMHNGAFTPLHDAITFYNFGNPEPPKRKNTTVDGVTLTSNKSPMLKPLNLTEKEISQLEAFLRTLSSRTTRTTVELPK